MTARAAAGVAAAGGRGGCSGRRSGRVEEADVGQAVRWTLITVFVASLTIILTLGFPAESTTVADGKYFVQYRSGAAWAGVSDVALPFP